MRAEAEPSKDRALAVLGEVSPETLSLVLAYLQALRTWNRKLDLTAAQSEDELCDLFLADAAELAKILASGARVCDVGSGAGAPGMVLALLRPDLTLTLIEPLAKRTSFLRSFWATHADRHAPKVSIVREAVAKTEQRGERFEVAISRATFEPRVWLEHAEPLVDPGGQIFALLAKEPTPQPPAGLSLEREVSYEWPLTGRQRRLVEYRRR